MHPYIRHTAPITLFVGLLIHTVRLAGDSTPSERTGPIARIATPNIRHGGRRNGDALTNRLLGYDADILVVTEGFVPIDLWDEVAG